MIKSFEEILNDMLSRVPNELDKRVGGIIYDALAPAAAELAQMYILIDYYDQLAFADSSTGDYLTRRCSERGVVRRLATSSTRIGLFNKKVPIGCRFSLEDTTYVVIEPRENPNEYLLSCEQAGSIGNRYFGQMSLIDRVDGLIKMELGEVIIPGRDDEDDKTLRSRYFDTLNGEAFGGNVADYRIKVKGLKGVGGVKVYPAWNGGGTVKLVIIGSDFLKPSSDLVNQTQTTIDPEVNQGLGVGIAPIGHVVTINPVDEMDLIVSSSITMKDGYVWDDVKVQVQQTVEEYLSELRKDWESQDNIIVRASHIETRILQVTGVLDIENTQLNQSPTNLIVDGDSIPKLKEVINL